MLSELREHWRRYRMGKHIGKIIELTNIKPDGFTHDRELFHACYRWLHAESLVTLNSMTPNGRAKLVAKLSKTHPGMFDDL